MVTEAELLAAVEAAFAVTRGGLDPWPNPHVDGFPLDEEYSRVTDAGTWRLIGARADAWLLALADHDLAVVERDTAVEWREAPGTAIVRSDRVVPHAAGALPLVVARSRIGDVDDAGITLGVGDPAEGVLLIPHCGCDACDGGSQYELDAVDAYISGVVSGAFRRLTAGDKVITVTRLGRTMTSTTELHTTEDVDRILAEPAGWDELSGRSWFSRQ